MDKMLNWNWLWLLCALVPIVTSTHFETCERGYDKMGCVQEANTKMKLILNYRNNIDWRRFPVSIHSLACRCSQKGRAKGYTYFSIRFWGECWAGKSMSDIRAVLADKTKLRTNCVGYHPKKKCNDTNKVECVGTKLSGYVYSIKPKVDGGFSDWSTFTKCSRPCGIGTQSRSRSCTNPAPKYGGKECVGATSESRACNTKHCPVDGGLTNWSNYTACSASCGGGSQTRSRSCTNPPPAHHGKACVGALEEQKVCSSQPCPVDGGLSNWSDYTACSASCGGGNQTRSRSCTNPPPAHHGKDCVGTLVEQRMCNSQPCPVDGGLTNWSNYTACSASCGGGSQTRSRSCTNPPPAHNGKACVGALEEQRVCSSQPCPVDGGLSNWSHYTACSASCGGGNQTRSRSCTNPPPAHLGKDCVGALVEQRMCNSQPCPVDGGLTSWTIYTSCSTSCGVGTQRRSRSCTNPPPAHHGEDCVGALVEEKECNLRHCPVDGGLSNWSPFSRCSRTCGGGYQRRVRSCTNPPPSHGGKGCVGILNVMRICNTQRCQCNNYRFLGRQRRCHTNVYTHIRGRCDGWQRVGLEECKRKCNRNDAPGGCPRRQCKYVIWDTNPGTPPGWCQLATDGCRIGGANNGHHLFVRQC